MCNMKNSMPNTHPWKHTQLKTVLLYSISKVTFQPLQLTTINPTFQNYGLYQKWSRDRSREKLVKNGKIQLMSHSFHSYSFSCAASAQKSNLGLRSGVFLKMIKEFTLCCRFVYLLPVETYLILVLYVYYFVFLIFQLQCFFSYLCSALSFHSFRFFVTATRVLSLFSNRLCIITANEQLSIPSRCCFHFVFCSPSSNSFVVQWWRTLRSKFHSSASHICPPRTLRPFRLPRLLNYN